MCDEQCDCASVKYVNKCVCKLKKQNDFLQYEINQLKIQINQLKNALKYYITDIQNQIQFIDKVFTIIGDKIEINVPTDIYENGHIIGTAIFNDKLPSSINIDAMMEQNYDKILNGGTELSYADNIIGTFTLINGENMVGATNTNGNILTFSFSPITIATGYNYKIKCTMIDTNYPFDLNSYYNLYFKDDIFGNIILISNSPAKPSNNIIIEFNVISPTNSTGYLYIRKKDSSVDFAISTKTLSSIPNKEFGPF
jgi:hypothetical protein